ncbi:MAG: hypothetical protein WD226_12990 [Planctomycetota bacterium]
METALDEKQQSTPTVRRRPGWRAYGDVLRELIRAAAQIVVAPFSIVSFLSRRERLCLEVACDLEEAARVEDAGSIAVRHDRPLHIFVAAAEASGETHAVSLVRALRAELASLGAPPPRFSGLGGERLAAEGVVLVANPVARAAMGSDVLASLPFYVGLLAQVAEHFRDVVPDVVVPVDSPALNVPIGHIAQRTGRRVVHFVAPQYWGWAPWRVRGYRKAVDRALTILPFERPWFRRRRVDAYYVGHPLLDELAREPVTRPGDTGPLVLLPGSRASVIERNLPWMLGVVEQLRERLDGPLEVVLPHSDATLAATLQRHIDAAGAADYVRLAPGDLHATLRSARAALSVSGTILIDLLHHRLPCVVLYRMQSRLALGPGRRLLTVPYFSSINLLAGRRVVPEYAFVGRGPVDAVVRDLERCLQPGAWRRSCILSLERAAERLGPPGAARRAARQVLAAVAPASARR